MLMALRRILKACYLPIKLIYVLYGMFFYSCILLVHAFWHKPSRSVFLRVQPKEISIIFNGSSLNITEPTAQEAEEMNSALESNASLEVNIQKALEGNRALAYLLAVYFFKASINEINQSIYTKKPADEKSIEFNRSQGRLFLSVSASLGFSSAFYLLSSLYSGLLAIDEYDDYLGTVYYLCWALHNNNLQAIEQSKTRIIYQYGLSAWEDIQQQAHFKIALTYTNQEKVSQSSDKKSFIQQLQNSADIIIFNDAELKKDFWKTYTLKDYQ